MTRAAKVPAREPASDILYEAARLGLELQPETLPSSAAHLYEAIYDSLIPRLNVREPHCRRVALDTAITPCAEHAGKRLVAITVHRVERVIAGCFALYDLQPWCVPHSLRILALSCRGGFPVPSLKDLANQVRDEQSRRAYDGGADYPSLARCHDLTHGASANSSTSAEPQAASELPPAAGRKSPSPPFLRDPTIPAGRCRLAGTHAGKPALPEPAFGSPIARPMPDRFRICLAHAPLACRAPALGCADVCGFGMAPTPWKDNSA